ncbi:hypothetical protein GCM10011392_22210 [Wenxinia marina]|uniref:hypothetical protein n=1 Tax=Wenxinia marina TaxID=390641 RepID=UPI00035D90A1|nr:hypothetical protein [Wenxinia marina]GGL67250.1 hypothetical protein GCM10011392_22210 [Wenxinia marina]
MLDDGPTLEVDLRGLSPDEWRARLDAIGDEHGYFLPIGADHSALFIDAGPKLLVTFEEASAIRRAPGARPRGFEMAAREGWSLLAFIADGPTWFRSDAMTWFVDRQVDDGFFEDFDSVLFHGSGMGGYAAGAYSVAAPGCRVLLHRPVATLEPAVAGWDRRDLGARRLDFTTRYGFAPEMVDAALAAWVVHDPLHAPDAMHAALFRRPNVTLLRAPLAGARLEQMLELMDATPRLLSAAMDGTLDRAEWGRIWRGRREIVPYARLLLRRAEGAGREDLSRRICRYGLQTSDAALYAPRARELGLAVEPQPAA